MPTWNHALVTGASSGLGADFAEQLAADGSNLTIVARTESRLQELAARLRDTHGVEVTVAAADLGDATERARIEALVDAGDFDLVVNNAGYGDEGPFVEHDRDREAGMVEVNVTALHRLTHAAAQSMTAKGGGAIVNVASIAAFTPAPNSATYAATKSFVLSFSDALHTELKPKGVTVTCVCPGLTRTEFQERGGYEMSKVPDAMWQTSEEVVRATLDAARSGDRILVPGAQNKALAAFTKVTPAPLLRKATELFR